MKRVETSKTIDTNWPFGSQMKYWRKIRGLSQLDLSLKASSTPRYISFIETGRSRPSKEMIIRIADALEIPIRERNDLLIAAGLAPIYPHDGFNMEPYQNVIQLTLDKQNPYPAWVVNRWYDIIQTNAIAKKLLAFDDHDSNKPINLVKLIYSDNAFSSKIDNWEEIATVFAYRLQRESSFAPSDKRLAKLVEFAHKNIPRDSYILEFTNPVVCPNYIFGDKLIRTIAMVASFGTAKEMSLEELRLEMIYPYDDEAEEFFRKLGQEDKIN